MKSFGLVLVERHVVASGHLSNRLALMVEPGSCVLQVGRLVVTIPDQSPHLHPLYPGPLCRGLSGFVLRELERRLTFPLVARRYRLGLT